MASFSNVPVQVVPDVKERSQAISWEIGVAYLFDTEFQAAYLEKGVDCYVDLIDKVPSASQVKKDARALYGALFRNRT
jgi:hypothetical protein